MIYLISALLMSVCTWCSPPPTAEHGQPIHSHNDYWRRAPLLEALDAGCISIEADVFAHNGELAVAHDRNRIQDNKTLTAMYLEPLAKIVRERKKIYPEDPRPLILMIDIKSNWSETLPVIRKVLTPFRDVLHEPAGTYTGEGGIQITTSGAGAGRKRIPDKVAAVDGRPDDLGKGILAKDMPVISFSFRSRFSWSMKKPLSQEEIDSLTILVDTARKEGKILRLWGAPDNPAMWDTLQECGVGLINTDQPKSAAKHLQNRLNDQ